MHEPVETTLGIMLAFSQINNELDFILDVASARLIVTTGIALLLVWFA